MQIWRFLGCTSPCSLYRYPPYVALLSPILILKQIQQLFLFMQLLFSRQKVISQLQTLVNWKAIQSCFSLNYFFFQLLQQIPRFIHYRRMSWEIPFLVNLIPLAWLDKNPENSRIPSAVKFGHLLGQNQCLLPC